MEKQGERDGERFSENCQMHNTLFTRWKIHFGLAACLSLDNRRMVNGQFTAKTTDIPRHKERVKNTNGLINCGENSLNANNSKFGCF